VTAEIASITVAVVAMWAALRFGLGIRIRKWMHKKVDKRRLKKQKEREKKARIEAIAKPDVRMDDWSPKAGLRSRVRSLKQDGREDDVESGLKRVNSHAA
jgi:hypothetical protein